MGNTKKQEMEKFHTRGFHMAVIDKVNNNEQETLSQENYFEGIDDKAFSVLEFFDVGMTSR